MKRFVLLLVLTTIFVMNAKTIERNDLELLEIMLQRSGLEMNSLNFLKDWSTSTQFKLPEIVKILNNPLEYACFVDELALAAQEQDPSVIIPEVMPILAYTGREDYKELQKSSHKAFERSYLHNVHETEGLFEYVEAVWDSAEYYRKRAWADCSRKDIELWEYLAAGLWQEPQDSLEYNAYYKKYEINADVEVETDSLIAMIKRIDLEKLFCAAVVCRSGFAVMETYLQKVEAYQVVSQEYMSRYGLMRIGSAGNDLVEKDFVFSFDAAGNDTYLGRLKTSWEQPYLWVLDLQGNDHYSRREIGGLAGIKAGVGILHDISGDDVWRGGDYCASAFWGYCEVLDGSGNDLYDFGLHSAGAATFGVSILMDISGSDSYRVTQYGEGFGSTLGFGAIFDYAGYDNYYAGGKYLHIPLAPRDYRSLSQGFGFGMRPDLGGGIGMIYDHSGNDNYTGGVYSQAVAYWYALGIIYDRQGYDYYDSVYYPQGSGIHLAGGFLYDGEGEDHYYSKHGPGQGAAHDWAVGFLIDRSGNDHYSVEGGNGAALTNSVTIFIDGSGDDCYQRPETNNYGYSRPARGTGGIGIFLDSGGNDDYPVEVCANDSFWCRGYYGIGLDTLAVEEEKEIVEMSQAQAAEVDSLAEIEEIWQLAAGWGVGSNQATVKRAAEVMLTRAEEAARYISANQLGTKSGLAYRAISNFNKNSDQLVPYLIEELDNADSLVAKNCLNLIGEKGDSTHIELFKPFLAEDKYTRNVLGALGDINCKESVRILAGYITHESEKVRYVTAASLKALKRQDSDRVLLRMQEDESFLIRTMIKMYVDKKGK